MSQSEMVKYSMIEHINTTTKDEQGRANIRFNRAPRKVDGKKELMH